MRCGMIDFHHTAVVALTGRDEAYYTDYRGTPQEFISCAKYGYLYQGQFYRWQKKRRGTAAFGLEPAQFIAFLENHDQVANSGFGRRVYMQSSPGRYRAVTTPAAARAMDANALPGTGILRVVAVFLF